MEKRGLLYQLVRRDFEQRFVGSAIGWVWAVIHPLVLLVSWYWVFTVCMGVTLPKTEVTQNYPLFLFAGQLPWLLFRGDRGGLQFGRVRVGRFILLSYEARLCRCSVGARSGDAAPWLAEIEKKFGAHRSAVPTPVIDPRLSTGGVLRAPSGFSLAESVGTRARSLHTSAL